MKDFDIYFVHTLSVSIADFSKLISVIFLCSFCSLLILDEGYNGCKKYETIVFVITVCNMFSIWQSLSNLVVLAIFGK